MLIFSYCRLTNTNLNLSENKRKKEKNNIDGNQILEKFKEYFDQDSKKISCVVSDSQNSKKNKIIIGIDKKDNKYQISIGNSYIYKYRISSQGIEERGLFGFKKKWNINDLIQVILKPGYTLKELEKYTKSNIKIKKDRIIVYYTENNKLIKVLLTLEKDNLIISIIIQQNNKKNIIEISDFQLILK